MSKEEFEGLCAYVQKGMKGRGKCDLFYDEYRYAYYIQGQFRGAEFSIDEEEEAIAFFFKGTNDSREEYLVNLISEFKDEKPDCKYVLRDAMNCKREDRVHEWTQSKERIEFIKKGGDYNFPIMVTCFEEIKKEDKGQAYTKRKKN